MNMDKKQARSFVIGTVLGDSSLPGKSNKYLFMGHAESQKDYLDWKVSIIKNNFPVGLTYNSNKMSSPSGKRQPFHKYFSTTHHRFTSIYNRMYVDGKKRITPEILKIFCPIGLAVLFMDDGCKETDTYNGKRRLRSYKISLGGFPRQDVELLSKWLYDEFDIESKVYLEHKKYPYLKVCTKSNREKFAELIRPYMHPTMLYKIQV